MSRSASRFAVRLSCITVLTTVLGAPGLAGAQAADPFKDLPNRLQVNDRVRVIDTQGHRVDGRVSEISSDSITVGVPSGMDPRTRLPRPVTQVVLKANTRQIVYVDSTVNGALIGATAAVPGVFLMMAGCGESGSCGGAVVLGLALFGGGGAVAGMVIDGAINKTVYSGNPTKKTVAIAPVVGGGRRGVVFSLRF